MHVKVSPIDLVARAEALLVPLQRLLELQGPVEGPFIGQQPLQRPAARSAAAEPQTQSHPLPQQRQPPMTGPLTAHASPSDTSSSPGWEESRNQGWESRAWSRCLMKGGG